MKGVGGRLVVLALVVAASASAAQPASNGRILVIERGDLFTVTPDGNDRRQLTFDGRNSSPSFSPNGERIAFLKSDGSSPRDLYVMNADGSGGARLIASHPEASNAGGIRGISWSHDSTRIAYFLQFGSPAIRVVDASDGTPFALRQVGDPHPLSTLEWSPDGGDLLYDDGNQIFIKPLDGRPARRAMYLEGQNTRATWSPDGTRIAFINSGTQARGGVYVTLRDGSELRHVAATGTALLGTVRWKADGTAVVFDATVPTGASVRNVPITVSRTLVAGAEGATIGVLRDHVSGPIPSPDDGQILLGRAAGVLADGMEVPKPGVYVMNADGSCLTLVTTGVAADWQPAPRVLLNPPRACVDLVVSMTAPGVNGMRGVPYSIVVRNEGTLPARNVRFRLTLGVVARFVIGRATGAVCSPEPTAVTCRIDELGQGLRVSAQILARPPAPGRFVASVEASSSAHDSDPESNAATLGARVRECWISGSDFGEELRGTPRGEEICGFAGNDFIEALSGNDVVDGGWGRDVLRGGSGRDRLMGGRGDDAILARDGERDVVDCGWGLDRVFADRIDRVLQGCDEVHRR